MPNTPVVPPVIDNMFIDEIIQNHSKLKHLKDYLLESIAKLDDSLIREQAAESTLILLSQYIQLELHDEKINRTMPTTATLPRSIRINIELTCSEKETCETKDFKSLQRDADLAKIEYQQKMRALFVSTMRLDRGVVLQKLQDTFVENMATLIETKVFFETLLLEETTIFRMTFKDNGGSKTAAGLICSFLLEPNQPPQPMT